MTKTFESSDVKLGGDKTLNIPVDKPLSSVKRSDLDIDLVGANAIQDMASELAFLEEPVEVLVHESTDENASMLVDVYHNGVPQRFWRGRPQTVKRKFLYVLATCKETSVKTKVNPTGGADGGPVNQITKHVALRYPFSVVADSNPRGPSWLRDVLQSAQ